MRDINIESCLPVDLDRATLIGRVWLNGAVPGPTVVAVRQGELFDISRMAPTTADLLARDDVLDIARKAPGRSLGSVHEWLTRSLTADVGDERLLAPCDLQAVKACGVTFAVSLLERVLEEQANGEPSKAAAIRSELDAVIGADLSRIKPGSPAAATLKAALQAKGNWSQYLEVGIGPDAEVFTKTQSMASLGFGDRLGLHPSSDWNNPEPEVVLAVDPKGVVRGATLGNDVNLRDIEGRSALLLGKAKDNNGSSLIGPFIRLFDEHFSMDDVRTMKVRLLVEGEADGFSLEGVSNMREISRDPLDLVAQTYGSHHQYPDGFMLYLGTMFSPIKDRGEAGNGFTHQLGDRVTIASERLGALINTVDRSDCIAPWTFGVRALYEVIRQRQALTR